MNRTNMGQVTPLGVFDVVKQCAGSGDGYCRATTTKAIQISRLKLSLQVLTRTGFIETPVGLSAERARPCFIYKMTGFGHKDFRGRKTGHFRFKRNPIVDLRDQETAATDVKPREPITGFADRNGQN